MLITLLRHDLKVSIRQRYDIALVLAFTLFAAFLFPLAIGSDPSTLSEVAVGVIWVLLVFAVQLSVPMVWRQDVEDGALEHLIYSSVSVESLIFSKALTLWILCLGTLFLAIPFLAYTFSFNSSQFIIFMMSFLIASVPLALLGVTGATLSLGHPRASILSIILMIPLYIPLVIFSSSAVNAASLGIYNHSYLWILLALSLILTPSLIMINVLSLKWMPDL